MGSPLRILWIGKATISEYQEITDPETHQTKWELTPVVTDEPCRLSYTTSSLTAIINGAREVDQVITLFISPDINITAGSVIEITQRGRTNKFKRSSEPRVYTDHQEVILEYDSGVNQ